MVSTFHRARLASTCAIVAGALALSTVTAFAQLDPLAFVKRLPPTVIVVLDTSFTMLTDGDGHYYDPNTYFTANDPAVAAAMGVGTAARYRRIYRSLQFQSANKYEAPDIVAVPDSAAGYSDFYNVTRYEIAKSGIAHAVNENANARFRWGLVKLRQSNAAWRVPPTCDKPVYITANAALQALSDSNPCSAGSTGRYGIYAPSINVANYSLESVGDAVVVAAAANTAGTIATKLGRPLNDAAALIPAGGDAPGVVDRPITHALEDAKAQAIAAIAADSAVNRPYRNTIVVLVTGGRDAGNGAYESTHDPVTTASTFASVTTSGVTHRIPIYVAAVKPAVADESELEDIADASGGRYFKVTDAAGVARVVNLAVQAGFARVAEFDLSKASEFTTSPPVIGTVNLVSANDSSGASLPHTSITTPPPDVTAIPQRNNFMLTAGFALGPVTGSPSLSPGFDGRMRAFRTFKPEADATKPSGWKFVKDGTRLWPDVDGRPETAGVARLPIDPDTRNIFTYVPGSGMVSFTVANAATLSPHLGGADPATLIPFVRQQPLGAIIGSMPAIMDPPSLDPPPDEDYGYPDAPGTYAGDHRDRRSIIWVGANDGMLHAFDARTGFEVWAFVPYNLLPKLRTLLDGHPMEQFEYFVDSSPKLAEAKVGGAWRTLLLFGQGYGGVFYQCFDVTEAGMGGPSPDSDSYAGVLSSFNSPSRVTYLWSFPDYSNFDTTIDMTFTGVDTLTGGRIRFYGDLGTTATAAEKSVGFTWSAPAIGPLNMDRTVNVAIAASGYFPPVEDLLPNRGASSARAGRTMYLINLETGRLLGNESGTACSGTGCIDMGEVTSNTRKNAVQADPTAAASSNSPVVTKAYIGDLDGKYWRLNFGVTGALTKAEMYDANQPIYGSSALMLVGSSQPYMFFATGSDSLPPTAPGGTGTFKMIGLKDNGSSASVSFTQNMASVTNSGGLASGERPTTSPSVAGDLVFFTTVSEDGTKPYQDFSSKLYAFTFLGGAAYDTNGDGKLSKTESPLVTTLAGRASAPFIVDQHLWVAASGTTGTTIEGFGDPEDFNNGVGQVGVRVLSWRELR